MRFLQENNLNVLCLSPPSFVFQLIKTHNLLPNRNYIFGYHPHGIFCFGAFCNFGTEATSFSKKFPGIRPSLATLAGNFRFPVLRDYLMSGGTSDISILTTNVDCSCTTTVELWPVAQPNGFCLSKLATFFFPVCFGCNIGIFYCIINCYIEAHIHCGGLMK